MRHKGEVKDGHRQGSICEELQTPIFSFYSRERSTTSK
jgi:hypothetical protein